jgi:hypothetical protein
MTGAHETGRSRTTLSPSLPDMFDFKIADPHLEATYDA